MSFTAKDVQLLRERTGVGMMDCKKALVEADGDMDKAINILREKGLAAAAKKSGRLAAEGMVYAYVDADRKVGSMVEVNSETDFVAKNQEFQAFVKKVAQVVTEKNPSDLDALLKTEFENGQTVMETLREKILVVGENLSIRRFVRFEGEVVSYVHGEGRIGVLVRLEAADGINPDVLNECGKDIAMQIAALNPLYLDKDSVPQGDIEKEKEILIAQIKNDPKNANKPEQIIEKMVEGRLGKFYENNCLLNQAFVKDNGITVGQYVAKMSEKAGGEIKVAEFVRFEKGEGLQKREDNFADEVASMIK
ncbi:MAG TPA: translation elongation factor Ts [Candidatus Avimonas sp.]|jgi:elongation factor Ts|nr:elongation factor Ts [Clostridiales bacterium]HOB36890.1 translation elongation factor Ts [Candidatus Avimonas sp.]HQA16403.1 translation elongation factor Ts [Candidatus Avimonas sp.]HQD37920.1 translation elongation factor Ts [Candidatus Avimonas sp.]